MKLKAVKIITPIVLIIISCVISIHFGEKVLSKNIPVKANILIIEGWLPAEALEMIPERVNLSGYESILITGMAFTKNVKSEAKNTADFLKLLGVKEPLITLDTLYPGRNRTRAYAVNCKKWIDISYKGKPYSINIISLDFHSKRTYFTYKSLEKGIDIGIISMPVTNSSDLYISSRIERYRYILKEYISLILNFLY